MQSCRVRYVWLVGGQAELGHKKRTWLDSDGVVCAVAAGALWLGDVRALSLSPLSPLPLSLPPDPPLLSLPLPLSLSLAFALADSGKGLGRALHGQVDAVKVKNKQDKDGVRVARSVARPRRELPRREPPAPARVWAATSALTFRNGPPPAPAFSNFSCVSSLLRLCSLSPARAAGPRAGQVQLYVVGPCVQQGG